MRRNLSSLLDAVSAHSRARSRDGLQQARRPRRSGARRSDTRRGGLAVESLEGRAMLATFTVTSALDTGAFVAGELRWAIASANANPGLDTVNFAIGAGPQTINLNAGLGALPAIGGSVLIDGSTQPGYAGTPIITVNGSALAAGSDGINFAAGSLGSTLQAVEIAAFPRHGAVFSAATSVQIIGNTFTGNLDGVHSAVASIAGTVIAGNVFQGNTQDGIDFTDAGLVTIASNIIGTSGANGIMLTEVGVPFVGSSVQFNQVTGSGTNALRLSGVTGTLIGGPGSGNVFSGSGVDGVRILAGNYAGTFIDSNQIDSSTSFGVHAVGPATNLVVIGNTIGAPAAANKVGIGLATGSYVGTRILANTVQDNFLDGIELLAGGVQDLVLGTAANPNVVRLNGRDGIRLAAGTYTNTLVDSNTIRQNAVYGIHATGGAAAVTIVGNTIGAVGAGNADGIGLAAGDYDLGFGKALVVGNTIAHNTVDGVRLLTGGVQNLLFGTALQPNTIEINGDDGIQMSAGDYTGTLIDSNIVRGNLAYGLHTVGAVTSAEIVGNTFGVAGQPNANGIGLAGGDYLGGFTSTKIRGNTIGANTGDGVRFLAAVQGLLLGDPVLSNTIENNGSDGIELPGGSYAGTVIDSNTIRGNTAYGILTTGGTQALQVEDNTIGAVGSPNGTGIGLAAGDYTAAALLGNLVEWNTFEGILTFGGVTNLFIGTLARPNTVQNNGANGIEFATGDYSGTVVQANTVATNGDIGIAIDAATNLTVGVVGAGNTVNGNTNIGIGAQGGLAGTRIRANTVTNNPIGIGLSGATSLAVGGVAPGEGNTITGSSSFGLGAQNPSAGTTVYGNTMTANAVGVGLSGAAGITIGGPLPGQANTIDANMGDGLQATGSLAGATVRGNSLQNNGGDGVFLITATDLALGGTGANEGNTINFNTTDGLEVTGVSTGTVVLGNEIRFNGVHGVNLQGATGLTVGGTVLGAANTIQANTSAGVFATGASAGTVVLGNLIDTNQVGVDLVAAQGITIDGGGAAASNAITANSVAGVRATGDNAGSVVRGNLVSGSPDGVILADARNLIVGGTAFGDGNKIFGNTVGVVASGNASGTVVLGNEIEGGNTGVSLAAVTGLTVGGDSTTGAGNVIDGNGLGIVASGTLTGTRVIGNMILDSLTGVTLSNAVNLALGDTGSGEGNLIASHLLQGVKATGILAGTTIRQNTIQDTTTGILLESATGLTVGGPGGGNLVEFNDVGLQASGVLTGTVVQGNDLVMNRAGAVLQASVGPAIVTNLAFGGVAPGAGNLLSGNTETGLFAEGDFTGTVVAANVITSNGNGVGLFNARNLVFGGLGAAANAVSDNLAAGIYATGDLVGTSVSGNMIDRNVAGAVLQNARNLVFGGIGSGNFLDDNTATGIWAGGTLTGTTITDNRVDGTGVGVGSSTGIGLDNAVGITVGGTAVGAGNYVIDQSSSGLYAIGTLAGTVVLGNAFEFGKLGVTLNAVTGATIGGGAPGAGNRIDGNTDAGLYAVGSLTGTVVQGNGLDGNTTNVLLVNATNLAFGGAAPGEGNATSGGGTGLYAAGTLTGTTVFGNFLSSAGTAVGLVSATGLTLGSGLLGAGNTISGVTTGLYATGPLAGTIVRGNVIRSSAAGSAAVGLVSATGLRLGDVGDGNDIRSTGVGGAGLFATGLLTGTEVRSNLLDGNAVGVSLVAGTGLTFGGVGLGNQVSNSLSVGLFAAGNCAGSFVLDTLWLGNPVNVVNTATGLTIAPPAP